MNYFHKTYTILLDTDLKTRFNLFCFSFCANVFADFILPFSVEYLNSTNYLFLRDINTLYAHLYLQAFGVNTKCSRKKKICQDLKLLQIFKKSGTKRYYFSECVVNYPKFKEAKYSKVFKIQPFYLCQKTLKSKPRTHYYHHHHQNEQPIDLIILMKVLCSMHINFLSYILPALQNCRFHYRRKLRKINIRHSFHSYEENQDDFIL